MQFQEYIAVFAGRSRATYLFQTLIRKGYKLELIPAPTKIAYGCCQAIRFREEYMDILLEQAEKKGLMPRGVYKVIRKGKQEIYERIM